MVNMLLLEVFSLDSKGQRFPSGFPHSAAAPLRLVFMDGNFGRGKGCPCSAEQAEAT